MGSTDSPGPPPTGCPYQTYQTDPPVAVAMSTSTLPPLTLRCLRCSLSSMGLLLSAGAAFPYTFPRPPSSWTQSPVPPYNKLLINSIFSSFHLHLSIQISLYCPYTALVCQRQQVIQFFPLWDITPLKFLLLVQMPQSLTCQTQLSSLVLH